MKTQYMCHPVCTKCSTIVGDWLNISKMQRSINKSWADQKKKKKYLWSTDRLVQNKEFQQETYHQKTNNDDKNQQMNEHNMKMSNIYIKKLHDKMILRRWKNAKNITNDNSSTSEILPEVLKIY